jgi:hypothetical protein
MSQYPQQYQPQYPNYPPKPAETNTLAIISLIAGILGFNLCAGIGSLIAIITGHIAKRQIRSSQGTQTGDGLATAGLVLGYIEIGIAVVGICLYLLFFGGVLALIGISAPSYN